jgi:hypothetical protein
MQISTRYLQFGQSVGIGKLSTVWSLEFFIATLFGSAQRVIFEFRVQHTLRRSSGVTLLCSYGMTLGMRG